MRYVFGFMCVLALGVMGCSETSGEGGTAGMGGDGGSGGSMGQEFPCTEQGIRDAIAEGGGPHFFACDGPTSLNFGGGWFPIDNDVVLDGEGQLTLVAEVVVFPDVTAELQGFTVTSEWDHLQTPKYGGIYNEGTLTLTNSTISGANGAIDNRGTLTLVDSTISENFLFFAGIQNAGTITIDRSEILRNVGGGPGGIDNFGTATITNSTLADNTGHKNAGAIRNSGTLSMTGCTLRGNNGANDSIESVRGTVMLTDTLIEGDCFIVPLLAKVLSNGGNIESPGDTCGLYNPTDQVNVPTAVLDGEPACALDHDCDDGNECTDDRCDATYSACTREPVHDDSGCTGGTCQSGQCQPLGSVFACDEQGLLLAIAAGDGPHYFACDGPTTIETTAEIIIQQDVILDGEGKLTIDGGGTHRVFQVSAVPVEVFTGPTVEFRGLTITGGQGRDGGGGIDNWGTLTLVDTVVSGNADTSGAGMFNRATLTATDSAFLENMIVDDPRGGVLGGGGIINSGVAAMTRVNISGNNGGSVNGGGITNTGRLVLIDSLVSGNTAARGGGIATLVYGRTIVRDSQISGNSADEGGGIGISGFALLVVLVDSIVSGNTAMVGGGIWNHAALSNAAAIVGLTHSTLSGNDADEAGGIYNEGNLVLTNSTIAGNSGAAIRNGTIDGSRLITLTNSTVAGADGDASPTFELESGTLELANSIVDGNCALIPATNDTVDVVSLGYNLESPDNTCGLDQPTDQVNVSADELKLGPLADNDGPTMTHALGAGSVAIDVIPEAECEVDTDQRGEPRPETGGTMCDVGAFEVQP